MLPALSVNRYHPPHGPPLAMPCCPTTCPQTGVSPIFLGPLTPETTPSHAQAPNGYLETASDLERLIELVQSGGVFAGDLGLFILRDAFKNLCQNVL